MTDHPFTIGIEEEYLLVDPRTRDLVADPPRALQADCEALVPADVGAVQPEFLRAQVEVGTSVCASIPEARERLAKLRRCVRDAAAKHGLAPIAASTHPFANWRSQRQTDKERYDALADDLQEVAQRLLICGMHVHVGIANDDTRIDLMNQVAYFLPHLLALSTSSPFWQGRNSGLMSYRIAVFNELPRTGLPERFDSYDEYLRHLKVLESAGVLADPSKIWWDIRPHNTFPTLEMRFADVCTALDDGIAVAAMYQCLLSMLVRLQRNNQRWRIYSNMLVSENRWRAQRYGYSAGLVDFGKGEIVPFSQLLDEMIMLVWEDADTLGCLAEIEHTRDIVARGTSAHHQLAVYQAALAEGADEETALKRVVDWLIAETMRGV